MSRGCAEGKLGESIGFFCAGTQIGNAGKKSVVYNRVVNDGKP